MRLWATLIGTLLVLGLLAGMTYKLFFQSTQKTVIGKGGKQVIINTEVPKVSLFNFGCSNLAAEVYWRKHPKIDAFRQEREDVKK